MQRDYGSVVYSGADENIFVTQCICGERVNFNVNSYCISRCPNCDRGFRTELRLYVYLPDEKDSRYLDEKEYDAMIEKHQKEFEIWKEEQDARSKKQD